MVIFCFVANNIVLSKLTFLLQKQCQTEYSHLVEITSEKENDFIRRFNESSKSKRNNNDCDHLKFNLKISFFVKLHYILKYKN